MEMGSHIKIWRGLGLEEVIVGACGCGPWNIRIGGGGMLSIFFLGLELGTGFAFDMIVGVVTSPLRVAFPACMIVLLTKMLQWCVYW